MLENVDFPWTFPYTADPGTTPVWSLQAHLHCWFGFFSINVICSSYPRFHIHRFTIRGRKMIFTFPTRVVNTVLIGVSWIYQGEGLLKVESKIILGFSNGGGGETVGASNAPLPQLFKGQLTDFLVPSHCISDLDSWRSNTRLQMMTFFLMVIMFEGLPVPNIIPKLYMTISFNSLFCRHIITPI